MKKYLDIAYCENGVEAQKLDLWLPEKENFPVFVFFHGGGLEAGDKADEAFIPELVEQGIAVVSANYRMYPDAVFPQFLEDAAAAVKWVFENISRYGKAEKIFVGGSSAGGYITQMLCFDSRYLGKYGISTDAVAGYVMDAGQPTTHYNVLRERGVDTRRVIVDEAAPLYFIEEAGRYAPMLVIVAAGDMENRYEQTMLLLSTLKHFGKRDFAELKVVEGSGHCQYHSWTAENGKNVFGELVREFIGKHTD